MRKEKTIREITEQFGVTRRAIQGYEKKGLVTASGKNKYGYLLYDEEALRTILQIKRYQAFGFRIKEIEEFISAPVCVRKEMLKKQITKKERILDSDAVAVERIKSDTYKELEYGSIDQNDDTAFRATLEKYKEEDYEKYTESCKEKGFTVQIIPELFL